MFVVYIGSIITTLLWFQSLNGSSEAPTGFILGISIWLWLTVLFANFAEALAEGRSKAQAASLRGLKQTVQAKTLTDRKRRQLYLKVPATDLRIDDVVLVEAGDLVPTDGVVIDGAASVDESAITGESAPVIREAGGDFSSVTGGTRVLSDWIVDEGHRQSRADFPRSHDLDGRRCAPAEDAERDRTDDSARSAHADLPAGDRDAAAFLAITASKSTKVGAAVSITALIALLVCLIPTTIGGLLSAIGIAGMSRMMQANVIATSGRAVEAAGDVDVLLLDKTGTITLGNRQAAAFIPAPGVTEQELADAAQLASLSDETPEGRSIVVLAKRYNIRERGAQNMTFIPFSAHTRMSGVDTGARKIRKGAADAIRQACACPGRRRAGRGAADHRNSIARRGSTPLVVVGRCPRAGHDRTQGHRQGRHQGALCRTAPHGHQDHHDHRRQRH